MNETTLEHRDLKSRVVEEMRNYLVIFAYLAIFFAVFAWHRRLILQEEHQPITDFWVPVIEAAVLAKVILIFDLFGLGRGLEGKPLIVPTLFKTMVFGLGIAVFGLLEHTVEGLFHGEGIEGGVKDFEALGRYELLSRVLVKSFALVPFFACREVGRVLGKGRLAALFWRKRAAK
jgi:hypothetical protein